MTSDTGRDGLTFLTFLAVNDRPDLAGITARLDECKALGFDGTVWHPRNYPGDPDYLSRQYFDLLSAVILHAKRIGMEFWIYDENGWPSGSASGKVHEMNPDLTAGWLEYRDGTVVERSEPALLNTFNAKTCADFIRLTYDGHKTGLDPEAFDHLTGFFSDEVGFLEGRGATFRHRGVPWCSDFAARYEGRYGEPLDPRLLFAGDGPDAARARANYWELATDLLDENFHAPINAWCEAHGKAYTAHAKGEESPYFQVPYSGSVYQVMRHVSVPAIDALERDPGNHYYPHIASSIARQFHSGRALCEAMGGAGWGVNPESWERYMRWLIDCGVDTFVLHLSQYRLKAQAIRDWPASQPLGLTWRPAFGKVLADMRDYAARRSEWEAGRDRMLVVCPTRGVMERFDPREMHVINEHDGDGVPDSAAGRISKRFNALVEQLHEAGESYDVTEERIVDEFGEPTSDGGIRIGTCTYHRVVMGEGCSPRVPAVRERLRALDERPDSWRVLPSGANQLPLDLAVDGGDYPVVRATFDIRRLWNACITLVCSDPVRGVEINGMRICPADAGTLPGEEAPARYAVPAEILRTGSNAVTIHSLPDGEPRPFVWLRGDFRVLSESPYFKTADPRQAYTLGPFELAEPSADLDPADLTSSGMPFRFAPVIMTRRLAVDKPADHLRFTGVRADAIHVMVDGRDAGWAIGPEYAIRIAEPLTTGTHDLTVALYPSTYNTYGPHHHIDGDRHVISPAQYEGVRNFADHADRPAGTAVPGWHVVRLGLGDLVLP
ncbi:hypothetical protein JS533_006775 [Bifidobacterium amazonense]|uniref:Glycoside hydrolase n=1 Tax=Bifidobacterium amazonense TaxID=2809027 RepID=A0ABS9VVY3_9BIFI|nr:hypothetical protein [Bifidobacterium amazonense]MCH9275975.1 hypothetical protein [Bifidobacterium amazonense]